MRILFIHTYYKQRGGEDAVFENEIKLMESNNETVDSLIFNNSRFTQLKFIFSFFNPFPFIRTLWKIRTFKPDIIHIHNWHFGASPSVFIAAKILKIPIIHTLHNFRIICPSAVLFYKHKVYMDSISKIIPWNAIFKRIYRNSFVCTIWLVFTTRINYLFGVWNSIDCFICLTNSSKKIMLNSYLKLPEHKFYVKPNFVSKPKYSIKERKNKYFLYVGRLSEEKGLCVLLEAFSNIKLHLKIIGKGPLKSYVQSVCSLQSNISYLDFKDKNEIITELQESEALIVPSICYEPFGLVIIEAFSTATAVIASNIGAPLDLITEGINGYHFIAGDPNDLKRRVVEWDQNNDEFRRRYSINALSTYNNNFTASKNYNELMNIYSSFVKLR